MRNKVGSVDLQYCRPAHIRQECAQIVKTPDNLDYRNANKIKPANRTLCLISNLSIRAVDHLSYIKEKVEYNVDGVQFLVGRIYKKDSMSMTNRL